MKKYTSLDFYFAYPVSNNGAVDNTRYLVTMLHLVSFVNANVRHFAIFV